MWRPAPATRPSRRPRRRAGGRGGPDAGAVRGGTPAGGGGRGRAGVAGGRRRGAALAGRRVRRRAVLRGRDVRPRHQGVRRRAGPGDPAGGTIALINWTPQGLIGHLFKTLAPYAPPPAPGRQPAAAVGRGRARPPAVRRPRHRPGVPPAADRVGPRSDPLEFREYWKNNYGPTIAVYRHNADRPDRVAELDAAFLRLLTDWRPTTAAVPAIPPSTSWSPLARRPTTEPAFRPRLLSSRVSS